MLTFLSFSCGNNPLEIDVSDVNLTLTLKRFEQDLFSHKGDLTEKQIDDLNEKYTAFFQDFTQIMYITVKTAHDVTSIKQSPVLKGHLFLALS